MRNNYMSKCSLVCLVFISFMPFLFPVGCTAPARVIKMIPENYETARIHNYSVTVSADVGEKPGTVFNRTNPIKLTRDEFKDVIEASILKSGIFSKGTLTEGADYLLKVKIDNWESTPTERLDMDVILTTYWTLTEEKNNKLVWKDLITTIYTAEKDDGFSEIDRIRVAFEGAMRHNLQRGISQIACLELPCEP